MTLSGVPTMSKDPYSTEYLIDPYPFHEELREAGPVVWLEAHDVWATGRDESDILRKATGHLAFGQGIHGCVGKPVARIEGEAVLGALARKVRSIELVGEPGRHPNNTMRGFESLPVRFHA